MVVVQLFLFAQVMLSNYFFSCRSALDGLLILLPHLQSLKAQAAVKPNSDQHYKVFANEIGQMVSKLDAFLERAQILLAEAGWLDMNADNGALVDSAKTLMAQAKVLRNAPCWSYSSNKSLCRNFRLCQPFDEEGVSLGWGMSGAGALYTLVVRVDRACVLCAIV